MKAHLTKVSLALLSAAFLLGCQEQGSEPVGPEGLEIQAKKGNNKGKGDGDGNQVTPARITFRNNTKDRIQSDDVNSNYEHDESTGLLVFIGSKANTGNIFLRGDGGGITGVFPEGTRALFLDFTQGCENSACPPLPSKLKSSFLFRAGLRVEVKKAIKDGVFAMGQNGVEFAPMRVQFQPLGDDVQFGEMMILYFDPGAKNCKGSSKVKVTRLGNNKWEVEGVQADGAVAIGCLLDNVGSQNREFLGLFEMPFEFMVEVL